MSNKTMTKRQTKDEAITFRVTPRVRERVEVIAAAKDQAVGEYVRLAVLRAVEADERRAG